MKKWGSLLCAMLMLLTASAMAEHDYYRPIPTALTFSQTQLPREYLRDRVYVTCTLPETTSEKVNGELETLILSMREAAAPTLREATTVKNLAYVDVGTNIFRTGDRVMSFLTIARTSVERQQTYIDFDARTYDMQEERRLLLTDFFDPDSEAWNILADAVREQLNGYFSEREADPAAVEALCTHEALEGAAFTMTPARLVLHYRTDALYPGTQSLMHVELFYRDIRGYMNAFGQAQTDNRHYRLAALTYDDGPALGTTNKLMDQLRIYGASVTFFTVGTNIEANPDMVIREHDALCEVASHTYAHEFLEYWDKQRIFEQREKMDRVMDRHIGQRPRIMRAPGGAASPYLALKLGFPVIRWDISTGDSSTQVDEEKVARLIKHMAAPGMVILMHDLQAKSPVYTADALSYLNGEGFMFVTVPELYAHYGVDLEPNTEYDGLEDLAHTLAGEPIRER